MKTSLILVLVLIIVLVAGRSRMREYYIAADNIRMEEAAWNHCEDFLLNKNVYSQIPVLSSDVLSVVRWIDYSDEICVGYLRKHRILGDSETVGQFRDRREREQKREREREREQIRRRDIALVRTIMSIIAVVGMVIAAFRRG